MVNTLIPVSTQQAAKRYDYHAEQRHAAIERTEFEAGVEHDNYWARQAQKHMDSKPGLYRTYRCPAFESFSQGIGENQQHHRAPDDSEPVSDS